MLQFCLSSLRMVVHKVRTYKERTTGLYNLEFFYYYIFINEKVNMSAEIVKPIEQEKAIKLKKGPNTLKLC